MYNNPDMDGVVNRYLNRKTVPANINNLPDRFYYEWYAEDQLHNEGIKIDYSKYKADIEIDSTSMEISYKISGSVQLIKESTKEVLKTINFNDTLSKNNAFEAGLYKFTKGDITMLMDSQSSGIYKLEFSGDDLLKLGIIKK